MASATVVRSAVRQLLQSSPSYRQLPPDKQREIASDMVRVASYMADPGGLVSRTPPTAPAPRKSARARGPAAAHLAVLGNPKVLDAGAAAAALLQQVDFPDFVGDLINGVFSAIVNASIQQMEAYANLIKQVASSVDQFAKDSLGEPQGRDWLAQRFPAQLDLDPRGRLRWRVDPQAGARTIAAGLLMPDREPDTRALVAAARRRMAIDRQQLLATMVMMGINRIVVTDGSIKAGC